jgi:hypothetical protein
VALRDPVERARPIEIVEPMDQPRRPPPGPGPRDERCARPNGQLDRRSQHVDEARRLVA